MNFHHALPVVGTCMAITFFSPLTSAESRIDRQTETAVPRAQNLYGIGVGVLPKTSGSDEYRALVLPIINANYGDRFFINALQAGAWLVDSEDKRLRFGLSAEAKFGWDASKGDRTRGMDDRDFSIFVGPLLRWQTDYGTLNAQWTTDASGNSNGQQFQVQYIKSLLRSPNLRLNGLVGATWNSQKFNNYYFGVRNNEVNASRPFYRAGSGVEWQAGINGMMPVMTNHSLLFGAFITRLSDEQYDSPITETRIQPMAYVGYSIPF
ncbi:MULTISPECIES: MipA/OmpV family protein [unclassified Methylophilus]|uniref:MipA/OmpV family protein n=1 Tax=unclassified Methylophilus TaxID=2630143 RepID=UPI0018906A9F|nr:MipA/OmpV family protein [Methylophilus sp. 13]MBF5039817.1 MipA/OmpV family protein [Methylophilus sp. 13]BEV09239.1 MipA/OmpV family protein [Methylophilus sp. DW102]